MRRMIVALALILAACAGPGPTSVPGNQPHGWVVLSMLTEVNYAPAIVYIRPVGASDGGGMGVVVLDALNGNMQKFGDTWGVVKTASYPPGTYEVFNFYLETTSMPKRTYRSREDFALRFEVKQNEVAYLGEFIATRTSVKGRLVDWIPEVTPYFIRADRRARDMAIATKATPELQGLPATTVALNPVKATPFIRSSRVD
jgi:hypothetical protein